MYSSLLAYTSPLVGIHLRLTLLLRSTNIKALEVNSFLQISIVEISGLEPELREPKSLVLPLHHISISSRSGRIRTLGGIYLGGIGDRCLKPLGHRPNDKDSYVHLSNFYKILFVTQVDYYTIHQSISSISCVHYISIHSRDILLIHHFAPESSIVY